MNPSLLLLVVSAGDDARHVLGLVDVAEVAADVGRMLALRVHPAAMKEGHILVLLRHLQDVRVEVTERSRENQLGAIEIDHALHGLLDGDGLRDHLLLANLDPRHFGQRGGALGVCLVVTVVGLGADVDETDRQRIGRSGGGRSREKRGQGKA